MDARPPADREPADLCAACEHPLPTAARFCPSCGQEVHSSHDERRIVTVLFADLVGFTGLAERRDPEQVKRFVDACFAALVADIEGFGGRVDKILGDGILALFGAPISHEDDAERAVRCALRMHRTLAEVAENVAADSQLMRIGVNTGEVLVGNVAGTEYTAMGDVVNSAARLQTAAPPGRVLVGEATRALTHRAIAYEAGEVLTPRGREQAITTWLAVRPTAPPGARHGLSDIPLVGRELELQAVGAMQALSSGRDHGVLITITAEAGMGKTRLLHEIGQAVVRQHAGRVWHSTCVPYGEANPWWPIATVLEQALGLGGAASTTDLPRVVAQRVASVAADLDIAARRSIVDMVCYVLGHPPAVEELDDAPARSAVYQPLARLLAVLARQAPTTITIDDVHWASSNVIDVLEFLAHQLDRIPVALVVAQRPHRDMGWWPDEHVINLSFELQPLGQEDTATMIRALLPDRADDPALATTIFERSGGNPLFVHEFAAMVRSTDELPVLPDTLRTIIGARLDQLPRPVRNTVDNAATMGTSGTLAALRAFGGRLGQPVGMSGLRDLEARGLMEITDDRWRFLSDSVRDTAYTTMSKTSRAQRHATLAQVLGEADKPSLDDLAHHTAAAAQLLGELGPVPGVSPTIGEDALRLLVNAARRAGLRGSFRIATAQATRGLELLPHHPSLQNVRADLLLIRAASQLELRQFQQARADVEDVLATVHAHRDPARRGEALRLLGGLHHALGDQAAARQALADAEALLRSSDRADLLARCLRSRGFIELFNGSLPDAEDFLGRADAMYATLGDTAGRAWIEQHRALAAFLRGDLDHARMRLQVVAEEMERLGDQNGVGWAEGMSAFVAFFQSDFDTADRLAQSVAARAGDRGDEWAIAMMRTLRAHVSLWRGNLRAALAEALTARAQFRRLGDPLGLTQALSALVRVQVALGMFDDARRSGDEIVAIAERSPLGSLPIVSIAGAAMHRGLAARALERAESAAAALGAASIRSTEPQLIMAMAAAQLGEFGRAAQLLTAAGRDPVNPFARAVESLLAAAVGDADHALTVHAALSTTTAAGYLDRALTDLAAVAALASLGRRADALQLLDRTAASAADVGDVILVDLLARARNRLDRGASLALADSPAAGWATLLDALFPQVSQPGCHAATARRP